MISMKCRNLTNDTLMRPTVQKAAIESASLLDGAPRVIQPIHQRLRLTKGSNHGSGVLVSIINSARYPAAVVGRVSKTIVATVNLKPCCISVRKGPHTKGFKAGP